VPAGTAKPPPLLGPHDARPEGPRLVGFCSVPFRYRSSRHRAHAPPTPRRRRKDAAALPPVRLAMTRSANTALHSAKPTRLAGCQTGRSPGHRITGPSSGNARKLAGLRRGLGHAVAPNVCLPYAQFQSWPAQWPTAQSPPGQSRSCAQGKMMPDRKILAPMSRRSLRRRRTRPMMPVRKDPAREITLCSVPGLS